MDALCFSSISVCTSRGELPTHNRTEQSVEPVAIILAIDDTAATVTYYECPDSTLTHVSVAIYHTRASLSFATVIAYSPSADR